MSDQYLGCTVSVKCIENLGSYQGQIIALNDQSVTLAKAFCNGVPNTSSQVTLRAKDIFKIDIVSLVDVSQKDDLPQSRVTVKRPIAKRAGRSVSECSFPISQLQNFQTLSSFKKLPLETLPYLDTSCTNGKVSTGLSKTSRKKMSDRDEQAFGTPIDQSLNQDFDFEKNLALFNKEAVWQEINSKKPDLVQQSQNRSDPRAKEYVTDDGLIIPSITLDLQRQLIGAADRLGISWERRVELLGRAGTEIILQLLGGAHRLNPNNAHQWPTVVALCGPHRSGAAGINCARQLSSHGVKTVVYVESSEDVFLLQELSLYRHTGHRVETEIMNLPPVADLIIVALCEEKSPRRVAPIAKWVSNNKASVLAIEPPSSGTPGIVSKYCLVSGLPLAHCPENGRLYLCNLALPAKLFAEIGITYRSPFGPKFVIPLHLNSS
ncbi:enhancer of mRNA-decapping protein 3 isoform X2 [Copidosoma floridanum]|uniref:enhancer of mRNA-decapping protein 3 isoform X2 n=1 Tax=Copidosoma floridanum TaxID=29053 RepID=UPI0006C97760|nr:enhancer of mRNA-decapping protein 3 isoform X2 [Copidosoma floridanum]